MSELVQLEKERLAKAGERKADTTTDAQATMKT
jgi:hypothetical protein